MATQEQIKSATNASVQQASAAYEQRQLRLAEEVQDLQADMQALQTVAAAAASTSTTAQMQIVDMRLLGRPDRRRRME